jgi:hypothetical protein
MRKKKNVIDLQDPRISELLSKKTPVEYIDYCVTSGLKSYEKAKITPIWLKITGFKIEDIQYARNRHPYWKEKKMKNSKERNKTRIETYNYSDGLVHKWPTDELREFLAMTNDYTDKEMAEHFRRTIPSIQYIRRRISLAYRIFKQRGIQKIHKESLLKKILKDEKDLRKEAKELEKSSTGHTGKRSNRKKPVKPGNN